MILQTINGPNNSIISTNGNTVTDKFVNVLGYSIAGDGGGGDFYWDNASTEAENGGTIFKVTGITTGRWKRLFAGAINLKWFGAVSDGNENTYSGTNNTVALNKAISACSSMSCPLIINGKYFTQPIIINQDNVSINLEVGSYLICNQANSGDCVITVNGGANNVNLYGYGAFITAPIASSGEWRHLININQCSNVAIRGITCINGGGDGIYIGSVPTPPTNILIEDVTTDNSHRNGISLVTGVNVTLSKCNLFNTGVVGGTAPMAGLDIEPNDDASGVLSGISVLNVVTSGNKGSGITVVLGSYILNASKTVDIKISNHISNNDGDSNLNGLGIYGTGSTWTNTLSGLITYDGIVINPGSNAFYMYNWNPDYACKCIVDMMVINAASRIGSYDPLHPQLTAAAWLNGSASAGFDSGNLDLSLRVRDTRTTKNTSTGVYFYNVASAIRKCNINVYADTVDMASGYLTLTQSATGVSKNIVLQKASSGNDITYSFTASVVASTVVNLFGGVINMTNGGGVYLPPAANFIGQSVSVLSINKPCSVLLTSGDFFIGASVNNTSVNLALDINLGVAKFEATSQGWKVDYTNRPRPLFTASALIQDIQYASAIPVDGTWQRGAIVINILSGNQTNVGWVCTAAGSPGNWMPFGQVNLGLAALTVAGLVKKSAAINYAAPAMTTLTSPAAAASYTQADVQKMVNDISSLVAQVTALQNRYEQLITNLRAAGSQT